MIPIRIKTRNYLLSKINLVRCACPVELQGSIENQSLHLPIVVEKNRNNAGYIEATDYKPTAVVMRGQGRRQQLLKKGLLKTWAYVECGIDIQADDAIGCNELLKLLQVKLQNKFKQTSSTTTALQSWPYISEVYPFENYFIYSMKDKLWRQHFTLDPIAREASLEGSPIEVKTAYVNASGEILASVIDGWSDVNEAVSMYLTAIKFGNFKPLRHDFAPVNLSSGDRGSILACVLTGPCKCDFARWSVEAQKDKKAQKEWKAFAKKPFTDVGNLKKTNYPILHGRDEEQNIPNKPMTASGGKCPHCGSDDVQKFKTQRCNSCKKFSKVA